MNKLGNAIAGHYAIAVLCGGALTAERDIFKQARKSVMEAVVKTRNAMAKDRSLAGCFKDSPMEP